MRRSSACILFVLALQSVHCGVAMSPDAQSNDARNSLEISSEDVVAPSDDAPPLEDVQNLPDAPTPPDEGPDTNILMDAPLDNAPPDVQRESGGDTADAMVTEVSTDAMSPRWERYYTFTMANQAFPGSGHPGVLVHIPPYFRLDGPLNLVVHIHGHNNCILNVISPTATACTPGGTPRTPYDLITSFDSTNVPAILILPEVRYDAASGDPGRLGTTNGFRAFLTELLGTHLAPMLGGPRTVEQVARVTLTTHSGGYLAVAAMATIGGVPQVRETFLLDSLYGSTSSYDRFVMSNVASFGSTTVPLGGYRFEDVYTSSGGTATNSVAMSQRARTWFAGRTPSPLLIDDTTRDLLLPEYATPVLFKRSALTHDGVVRFYFPRVLRESPFPR